MSFYFQKPSPEVFFKIGVIKNFVNFTGKHLCWSFFLIKFHTFRPETSLRRDSNIDVFLCVKFAKFFKNTYFEKHLRKACNFIKKRLQHKCFSMKFARFLGKPILKNLCERLLCISYVLHKYVSHV